MMKFLIVVPTLASYPFLRELCLTLVDSGCEVHLASSGKLQTQYHQDQSAIKFHSIEFPRGMNPLSHFKAANALNKLVAEIEPAVVDIHFSAAAFTAAIAKNKNWPATVATVQGLRFPLTAGPGRHIIKLAECWSARRMDKFIVLTEDDLRVLKSLGPRVAQQSGYGFGCDIQKFNKANISAEDMSLAKREIGKTDDSIVIGFIGRLVAFKGFHLVVRSFLAAYESNPNLRLVICGEYDKYHPSGLTDEERNQIHSHSSIRFTGWTSTIEHYLSVIDVVVFPSEREGVPVNLMEALSMGVPVITIDSRGCREVMNEGKNGILLSDRSTESLTMAMLEMAENKELRASKSIAATEFRNNFSRMHFVNGHIQVLQELANCQ